MRPFLVPALHPPATHSVVDPGFSPKKKKYFLKSPAEVNCNFLYRNEQTSLLWEYIRRWIIHLQGFCFLYCSGCIFWWGSQKNLKKEGLRDTQPVKMANKKDVKFYYTRRNEKLFRIWHTGWGEGIPERGPRVGGKVWNAGKKIGRINFQSKIEISPFFFRGTCASKKRESQANRIFCWDGENIVYYRFFWALSSLFRLAELFVSHFDGPINCAHNWLLTEKMMAKMVLGFRVWQISLVKKENKMKHVWAFYIYFQCTNIVIRL